ncbi:MAG: hypothetical protein HKN30_11320 [Sulfitobacter sp.]|nr:hypothetical protein [Sulfitobacter sp.]
MSRTKAARKIAEAVVAATGRALLADDFDAFHRHQELPQPIETFGGRKTVQSAAQMREIFQSVRGHQKRLGVTRLDRRVQEAKFVDEDHIEVIYQSDAYRGDELVQTPYPSFAILRRYGDQWKFVYCMYAVMDDERLNDALLNVPDKIASRFSRSAAA